MSKFVKMFPLLKNVSRNTPLEGVLWSVPWAFVEPHEERAMQNHGQTLERLAERGGLSIVELYGVLTNKGLRELMETSNAEALCYVLRELRNFVSDCF